MIVECHEPLVNFALNFNLRRPHEDALAAAAGDAANLAKAYRAYIALEEAGGDASRVQCMYERAVVSAPTDPVLWRRYTSYLDHTVKVRVMSAAAHARATRNCPTSGETWAGAHTRPLLRST